MANAFRVGSSTMFVALTAAACTGQISAIEHTNARDSREPTLLLDDGGTRDGFVLRERDGSQNLPPPNGPDAGPPQAPDAGMADAGSCTPSEVCGNGVDDDCNGQTDCADANCATDPSCRRCTPEVCGDDVDNDCDGQTDCADADCSGDPSCHTCVETTVDCGYTSCTDTFFDGSDPAACMAGGNPGRCPDFVWAAWCSRRAYPGSGDDWDNLHRDWVVAHCTGTLDMIGGMYTCRDAATCTTYQCTTPLVLVFDPDARVAFTPWMPGDAEVDLSTDGDGSAARSDWPTAVTPWLALDRDGNGRIESGRELFGSATLVDGRPAANGFDALAALDADHDGDVDADDPAFAELVAWADANGDRTSTPDELRPISSLGVTSLHVGYVDAPTCDARGNCERERAAMTWHDAHGDHDGAVVDVHVRSDAS